MDKKIYDLLNDYKVEEYEEAFMTAGERDRVKAQVKAKLTPKKRKPRLWPRVAAVAALLVVAFMTPPGQRLYAQMEQIYQELFSISGEANEPEAVRKALVDQPEKLTRDQGVEVAVKELLLDDTQLYLNLVTRVSEPEKFAKFDPEKPIHASTGFPLVYINGRQVALGGNGKGHALDGTSYQEVLEVSLDGRSLKESDTMKLDISSLDLRQEGDHEMLTDTIQGNWSMEFQVKDLAEELDTRVIPVGEVIDEYQGVKVVLDSIRTNALTTALELSFRGDLKGVSLIYDLTAYDEAGNSYYFNQVQGDKKSARLVPSGVQKEGEDRDMARLLSQGEVELSLERTVIPDQLPSGRMPGAEKLEGTVRVTLP